MSSGNDPFEKATTTLEELKRTVDPRPAAGIPTTWQDSSGKTHLKGPATRVVTPTQSELEEFTRARPFDICGYCKYFDLENGRKEIARQRFAERLVHDERWKLHHLGAPVDAIGLCGASNGELATSYLSRGCDQYRFKE